MSDRPRPPSGADRALDIGTRPGRVNVIALPVLAGSTMTMFDVGADSIGAAVQNNWTWEDGGGLFGVPWTNYIGWWSPDTQPRRNANATEIEDTDRRRPGRHGCALQHPARPERPSTLMER